MIRTSSDYTAMAFLRIKISTFKTKGVLSPVLNLHVYVSIFLSISILCVFKSIDVNLRIVSLILEVIAYRTP